MLGGLTLLTKSPSGSLMREIAQLAEHQSGYMDTINILDKRLNDSGKNWRHVYKACNIKIPGSIIATYTLQALILLHYLVVPQLNC
jgi:hypothetical protein